MSAECIHGFEEGMCATCCPAPEPVASAAVKRAAPRRTPATSRATTGARRAARVASGAERVRSDGTKAGSVRTVDITGQRLFHVTHVDNLAAILDDGALLADAELRTRPAVDITSDQARAARRGTPLPGAEESVASSVPFFLSADAYVWDAIRSGIRDPRLSAAAYRGSAYDYLVLVTTIGGVRAALGDDVRIVVADGDAAGPLTRFDADPRLRSLRELLVAEDPGDLRRAELLVPARVPFETLSLVGVANHAQRAAVRELLDLAGAKPRVSVYPPWFQAAR